jgi:hypothetical protein
MQCPVQRFVSVVQCRSVQPLTAKQSLAPAIAATFTHKLSVACTDEEWELPPMFLRTISEISNDIEFRNGDQL